MGRPDGDEPRPDPLPGGRADGGPARPVRGRGRRGGGAHPDGRRAPSSTTPSTAGSGTRAGPTSSARSSATRTPSPGRTSTSRSPSRPAWSGSSRRSGRRCSGSSAGSPRPSSAATWRSSSPRRPGRSPRSPWPRSSPPRTCPAACVNIVTGLKAELGPVLAAHVDVDAIDTWGVDPDAQAAIEVAAADSVKRLARRPARRRRRPVRLDRRPRRPASRVDRRLPGDEDGLASDRRLRRPGRGWPGRLGSSDGPTSTSRHGPSGRRSTTRRPRTSSTPSSGSARRRGAGRPPVRPARRDCVLGLLRTSVRLESLEARPESRFRWILVGDGIRLERSLGDRDRRRRRHPGDRGRRPPDERSLGGEPRPARSGLGRFAGRDAPADPQGDGRGRRSMIAAGGR